MFCKRNVRAYTSQELRCLIVFASAVAEYLTVTVCIPALSHRVGGVMGAAGGGIV